MTACIYTAIFGDYTTLKAPCTSGLRTQLICFTDNENLKAEGWEIRVVKRTPFTHPRMAAKWFKMNPDLLLPEYDATIWVDASFHIGDADAFRMMCLDALYDEGDGSFAAFIHPESRTIAQEAQASRHYWGAKYASEPLVEQIMHYAKEGFSDSGMWAGGILVRSSFEPWVRELNRRWMAECIAWSYQDQISLPYVLWRLGKQPNAIPGSIYQGENHRWEKGEDR